MRDTTSTRDREFPPPRSRRLTFDAFSESHAEVWRRYAHTQVGQEAATAVVGAACERLRSGWDHVLTQDSVARYAWQVLKEEIHEWLVVHERRPAFVETVAFRATLGKVLPYEARDRFTVLQEEIGLYAAIAELPERQYDTVVLLYVLGVPAREVAEYLGIDEATVRSHTRHARRKIAASLRLPDDAPSPSVRPRGAGPVPGARTHGDG